jgi:hypothetical protein
MKKILPKWWDFTTQKKWIINFAQYFFYNTHLLRIRAGLQCPIWQLPNIVHQGKLFVHRLHTTSFISQSSKKVCFICHVEPYLTTTQRSASR